MILTFGHSIVKKGDGWIPSDRYQAVTWKEMPNGRIPERTFIHNPELDPDDDTAYLGGGQLVVGALFRLWRERPHARVAIIGGRPLAMDQLFGKAATDESIVMADFFNELARNADIQPPKFALIGGTRTTEDDMRELLSFAATYDHVTAIAMQFREWRARLLLKQFAETQPQFRDIWQKVTFRDADQFFPELLEDSMRMIGTQAYRNTMRSEGFGIRKVLSGTAGDYIRAR